MQSVRIWVTLIAVLAALSANACEAEERPSAGDMRAADLALFDTKEKLRELHVPANAPDDEDTNFSGVAYNPATRTLLVVDNEPNAGDKSDRPDQGDLYEFEADGTYRRRIDLVGFSDPEGIALMGPDPHRPDHDRYVICEERIGTLVIVSIKRGKDDAQVTRGKDGTVIEPKPNPIDDGNAEPNDGLEGVAYDAKADVLYVVKEYGPKRGVYRVQRSGRCEQLTIPGLFDGLKGVSEPLDDLADVQFHAGQLYILSEVSNRIVTIRVNNLRGRIVGQFPPVGQTLPHKQPEGLAISDDGLALWVVGEPREFIRYRASNARNVRGDLRPALETHPINTWVKRTPLSDGPVSPRLGYEGACVWDSRHRLLVRFGGHNQGGGGEQGAEVWTFDLNTARWTLKEPNTSPPGVCCNAQNVFDRSIGRYIRFPLFSGNHGWQWSRELYLNDSSIWTYDLASNRWRNMRPLPTPRLAPYRCASWDSDLGVVVVFGGEGSREGTLVYDPWRNEWRWPKPAVEPAPRSGGNMAYDAARKVHVLFGSQFTNDPHTWAYDVSRNEWRDMKPQTMPPTNKNDLVLTYDPINRVVLALVKITSGEDDDARHEVQTWAYNAGANKWTRLMPATEPDAAGNRTRNLAFAPELNLAILENCTSRPREQQVWTYRYAELKNDYRPPPPLARDVPPIVEDAVVSVVAKNRVALAWKAPASAKIAGYHVERAIVEVWSEDQLRRLKQNTPPLSEPSVGAVRRIGPFGRITTEAIRATSFVDDKVDLGTPQTIESEPIFERDLSSEHVDRSGRAYRFAVFAYRVRAVNGAGKISGPSPALFSIPSSPQNVFSQEDGRTCRLKWAANPEKGIAGYRVYRMDGRWDKDPVTRLTPDPIAATTYSDEAAGPHTRRYYVVAVDALGQEGFPSSPVWYNREWQAYYKPFVGPWHQ